jgi:hypothetical protein
MVGTQGLCMSYSACKVCASALCGLIPVMAVVSPGSHSNAHWFSRFTW